MSKPNGRPVSPAEITLQPQYDMGLGDEVALPKKREKTYPKFTEENRREILLVFKAEMPVEVAAGRCRISPATIKRWLCMGEVISDEATGIDAEFRTFYLDVLEVKSVGILGMRALLQGFASRDAKVAMWLAERLYPEVFGRVGRVEHTGKDGGPIEVAVGRQEKYRKMSDEDLDAAILLDEKYSDVVDAEIVDEKG